MSAPVYDLRDVELCRRLSRMSAERQAKAVEILVIAVATSKRPDFRPLGKKARNCLLRNVLRGRYDRA